MESVSATDEYELLDGKGAAAPTPKRSWLVGATVLLAVTAVGVLGFHSLQPLQRPPPAPPITDSDAAAAGKRIRLRIINGCAKDSLWIANFAFQSPYFEQDLKLKAGEAHDFAIPDEGLAATRFWAKWGCDSTGANCKIGESGGPGESCGSSGCAPPVDSKFEATFGCLAGAKSCAHNPSAPTEPLGPIDWWDVSQVDGWTLPYKVDVIGECAGAPAHVDCSRLSLGACPNKEGLGGTVGNATLQLRDPKGSGQVVGCYSPCAKLTYSQWGQGYSYTPDSKQAQDYCCATPPVSPEQCSKGPVRAMARHAMVRAAARAAARATAQRAMARAWPVCHVIWPPNTACDDPNCPALS